MKHNAVCMFVFAALGLVTGCKESTVPQKVAENAVPVRVVTVNAGTNGDAVTYSGTIEEDNATIVSFATAGTIKSLNLTEGQRISKGQYIGSVDATQAENSLMGAKAMVLQAQDVYDRIKRLYDNKSVPEIKWVEAQSKLLQAKSAEQTAQKAVADCRLYAPASGMVSEKLAEVGQNVGPGTPVAKIVGVSVLKARIAVPEGEISSIAKGQRAVVTVEALGGRQFDAVMSEKGVVANPMSRSYDVNFKIQGSHKDLMPGMVSSVKLVGAQPKKGGDAVAQVVIPANVVQMDYDNKTFVWTVRNGKACKVMITCGDFVDNDVVVKSGLGYGDKVIVEGQHKVSNGSAVKVL